jgi:membrane-associated phospholipid phosphatase
MRICGPLARTTLVVLLTVGEVAGAPSPLPGPSGHTAPGARLQTVAGPARPDERVTRRRFRRESVVLLWNTAVLDGLRATRLAPMFAARALAIVHTCMYDAWAAYDDRAAGTVLGGALRRPVEQRTLAARETAVSHAAFRALVALFPSQRSSLEALMEGIGLDPAYQSTETTSPAGIGNAACAAVLAWRQGDGANQLGDLNGGPPYSDYTGYVPMNSPALLVDPNRWQPLLTQAGTGQVFVAPHWAKVTPFALTRPDQFRPDPPATYPSAEYFRQAEAIRRLSASLDDRSKVIAEYWADGPGTETPPGHWSLLAQFVARRDGHDLDADVKLFFVLANALLDVSIAVWDGKVAFDYVRPVTALRFIFAGQMIEAWGGPGRGTQLIPGDKFQSYIPTPPFAEYPSGHSAFSAASATVLRLFTGGAYFGASHAFKAGTSTIEPGLTPSLDIVLSWPTFDRAADEAGMSRRYGGIHFRQGDMASREIGRGIGLLVWERANLLFTGNTSVVRLKSLRPTGHESIR